MDEGFGTPEFRPLQKCRLRSGEWRTGEDVKSIDGNNRCVNVVRGGARGPKVQKGGRKMDVTRGLDRKKNKNGKKTLKIKKIKNSLPQSVYTNECGH